MSWVWVSFHFVLVFFFLHSKIQDLSLNLSISFSYLYSSIHYFNTLRDTTSHQGSISIANGYKQIYFCMYTIVDSEIVKLTIPSMYSGQSWIYNIYTMLLAMTCPKTRQEWIHPWWYERTDIKRQKRTVLREKIRNEKNDKKSKLKGINFLNSRMSKRIVHSYIHINRSSCITYWFWEWNWLNWSKINRTPWDIILLCFLSYNLVFPSFHSFNTITTVIVCRCRLKST